MHYVLPRSILDDALSVGDGIDQAISCATELCRTNQEPYIVVELVGATFRDESHWAILLEPGDPPSDDDPSKN